MKDYFTTRTLATVSSLVCLLANGSIAAPSEISGMEARAIALAVDDFLSKANVKYEGKRVFGDLKHYTLNWKHEGQNLRITLMPDSEKSDNGPNGEFAVGGETRFGWEVVYLVSLKQIKIIRQEFSR